MDSDPVQDEAIVAAPRTRRWRAALLLLLGVLGLGLLALWMARKPIATDLIDRELARRGVPARYEVKRIGVRTQRLEGVVIGDPRSPDLTAQWVEIDIRPTFGAPEVRAIRAGGVRLRGRLVAGRLRLGEVDRLLPAPSGAPFRLPDLPIAMHDAQLALTTPAGMVTLRMDGNGNLANGFAGRYITTAPALSFAGCRLSSVHLSGAIATKDGRPHFTGPMAADKLACEGASLNALSGSLDVTLQPALDGWRGGASLASGDVRAAKWSAGGARAQIDFAGDGSQTTGALRLTGLDVAGPAGRAPRAELGGRYTVEMARTEPLDGASTAPAVGIRFEGGLSAQGVAFAGAPRLDAFAQSVAGTPFEPLADSVARLADQAGRSSDLRASLNIATRGGEGAVRISTAALTSGGAQLLFAGGEGIRLVWPSKGDVQVDGRMALSGPRVPQIVAQLRQDAPGAPLSGLARMDPFVAGGARVALGQVLFEQGRFRTTLEASGPLAGGRVEGATLALDGRIGPSGLMLNPGCAPLAFQSLSISGLELQPATLRLCPAGRALVANGRVAGLVEAPRLRGTLGSNPITLAASQARFDNGGFRIAALEARLGGADRLSRLDIAELSGAPGRGLSGRFAGASGQIGNVPLIVSGADGTWRFTDGQLAVAGALTLSDEAAPARFYPLASRDFTLRLHDQALTAGGVLLEPGSGTRLASVALRHDLNTGRGAADIDVAALRFDPDGLQPERVTRLTLGIIANVDASLTGRGRIAWDGQGVTSDGAFRVEAASLAAPFGPVTGLAGDIRFTDLLNMVTAPDQTLTVATVNPGILVEDGVVRYRIVPGLKVAVSKDS